MNDERPEPVAKPRPKATVCHRVMTVDSDWYPHAEYKGRTVYFCTDFCLEAFRADPERFYIAHSSRKDTKK